MKLGSMTPIYGLLVASIAVAAMNLDPKSAALVFKHLNASLAPDALAVLRTHGLWTPSAASLNDLEPMFGASYDAATESDKFGASGLDINDLVRLSFVGDSSQNVTGLDAAGNETGLATVDVCIPYPSCCDTCHKCEEACLAGIVFFIIPWLICSSACWSQAFCNGCD